MLASTTIVMIKRDWWGYQYSTGYQYSVVRGEILSATPNFQWATSN